MADIYDKVKRRDIMSRVKHSRTAPEEIVARLLKNLGIKYRRNVKSLPGQPDFVIKSAKTVIFVHGCFWHDHSNCKLAKRPKSNNYLRKWPFGVFGGAWGECHDGRRMTLRPAPGLCLQVIPAGKRGQIVECALLKRDLIASRHSRVAGYFFNKLYREG